MTKLFFPYNDQPKQFSFKFPDPIRFPFYVNDLVYYWEIDSSGITLYLYNDTATSVKDVMIEDTGITIYLKDEVENTLKHIFVEFDKIGYGDNVLGNTLGELDPHTLGDIDSYTLGTLYQAISSFADWMQLHTSTVPVINSLHSEANDIEMMLESDSIVHYDKNIYIEIDNHLGIVGLNSMRNATLGELDPELLSDLDMMMSTFRMFENIPASLIKEIIITHNNTINNNPMTLSKDFSTNASNINTNMNTESVPILANIALEATEQFISIEGSTIPLELTIDS